MIILAFFLVDKWKPQSYHTLSQANNLLDAQLKLRSRAAREQVR